MIGFIENFVLKAVVLAQVAEPSLPNPRGPQFKSCLTSAKFYNEPIFNYLLKRGNRCREWRIQKVFLESTMVISSHLARLLLRRSEFESH